MRWHSCYLYCPDILSKRMENVHILTLKHYILLKEEDGGPFLQNILYSLVLTWGGGGKKTQNKTHDQVVAGISE